MTAVNSVSRLWVLYLTLFVCYAQRLSFTVFNVDETTVPSVDDEETSTPTIAPDNRRTTDIPRRLGTTPLREPETVTARTTPASRPRQTQPSQQLVQPPPPPLPQTPTAQQVQQQPPQPLPVAQQPSTVVAVPSPVDQNDVVPQPNLLPQSSSVSSVRPPQNIPTQPDTLPQPDNAPQLTTRPEIFTDTSISQPLQQPAGLDPLPPPPQNLSPQGGATNPPGTNPPQQVVEAEPAIPISEDLPITTRAPSDLELLSETSEDQDSPPFTEPF